MLSSEHRPHPLSRRFRLIYALSPSFNLTFFRNIPRGRLPHDFLSRRRLKGFQVVILTEGSRDRAAKTSALCRQLNIACFYAQVTYLDRPAAACSWLCD